VSCSSASWVDAYSRRIVGWQFAANMRTDLVLDAPRMALTTRDPGADVSLIHHSDAGSQYLSLDDVQVLDDHNVLASIGSVGDAYDNAMAASFVDSFKTELIADRAWRSRSQLELAIVAHVGWFNDQQLHPALSDIPPAEHKALHEFRYAAALSSVGSTPAKTKLKTNQHRLRETQGGSASVVAMDRRIAQLEARVERRDGASMA
jgi:putative transposase